MKKHMFSGADPLRISIFLSRYVNEADRLKMTDAQVWIALLHFLENPTESQLRSDFSGGFHFGGITWGL